jgi:hypothetical protein
MNKNTPPIASETPVPFRRPIAVAGLQRDAKTKFRVTAEPDELVLLAEYLGVDRIDKLALTGFISPVEDNGWRIRGRLVASIEQSCVVSLARLNTRHNEEIERLYLPEDQLISEPEVLVSHDDQDLPDPLTDSLDPAQLAVDELAQVIDPYPRVKNVELEQSRFAPPGVRPLSDETSNPFAGLVVLKPGTGNRGT